VTALITGKELWQWRRWALGIADTDDARSEIDWLLQSVANLDRLTLRLESVGDDRSIAISMPLDRLSALWLERVEQHQPVQYLLGTAFWRDLELVVSPAVLIPRPETELIIDIALAAADSVQQQGIWVDLGTGSGAIAIAIARSLPAAQVYAVDISPDALAIAQINATRSGVVDRVNFSQSSWWSSLTHLQGQVAVMLSNPPYIPSTELQHLQPEVRDHEPHLALDGGVDGLVAIRILVDRAPAYLQAGGIWLTEMMAGQGHAVVSLLAAHGSYTDIEIIHDLAGLDRFAIARLK
jgi:release factor glutamine methyltransferase